MFGHRYVLRYINGFEIDLGKLSKTDAMIEANRQIVKGRHHYIDSWTLIDMKTSVHYQLVLDKVRKHWHWVQL